MGWSGSLTASSAVGSSITFTSDTTTIGAYTGTSFTAPKKGIYKFVLKGSGGDSTLQSDLNFKADGGTGGTTTGYLSLEAGQTIYLGVGGKCSAAWVAKTNPGNAGVKSITASNLYFVAGGGGQGARCSDTNNWTGYNCKMSAGGHGGGTSGGHANVTFISGAHAKFGYGGTQTAGGAKGTAMYANSTAGSYGVGGNGGSASAEGYGSYGGRGGDGYYGGGGGGAGAGGGVEAGGGGGGSGYIYTSSITFNGITYTNSTTQGGGAGSNATGSIVVTFTANAALPIVFNGTQLTNLVYNGTTITSLIYNGTKLF